MMKKRISVKCIVLVLTAIALIALAGIGVMAAGSTGNIIEYRGRSLRINDTPDGSKTSLRFGYKIKLPEGATPAATEDGGTDWISWKYTMDGKNPKDSSTEAQIKETSAISVVKNEDGTYTANLVITKIPSAYYRRSFYAQMTVKYVDAEGNNQSTDTDVWRSTTIKEVVDAIQSTTPSEMDGEYEADATYAETLNKEIGNYAAMVVDRMYLTVPEAIEEVANNGTVSVLKITDVTKQIKIAKAVTLNKVSEVTDFVTIRNKLGVAEEPMIIVENGGKLIIDDTLLRITGNINAKGEIVIKNGRVYGKVTLAHDVSLQAGEGAEIVDSTANPGDEGLTSDPDDNVSRTEPLMKLLNPNATTLPKILVSETKAGTVVMDIPNALIDSGSGGIKLEMKKNAQLKLTCTDSAQLMWGEEKKITVQDAKAHIHCACGGNVTPIADCGTGHCDVEYQELQETTKAGGGGNYYLSRDIIIDKGVGIYGSYDMRYSTKDLNLCLNGHSLVGCDTKRIIYADISSQVGNKTDIHKVNVSGSCQKLEENKYGSLKAMGTKDMLGRCVNNTKDGFVNLYKVYLDGSEYNYTGTAKGCILYNNGTGSGRLKMYDCLISKKLDVSIAAYNGSKWNGLTEVDPTTMQPPTQ